MADPTIPAGWPCALLSAAPPSVADRQSAPTADDLLPQVTALTPRGAAWGRDEAGDGRGASPVMLRVWRAVATWVADLNRREFEVATQAFPSAITLSLADWEAELGLPGACAPGPATVEGRVRAVRARFGALGGSSPAYFTCLALSLGYSVTLEEPGAFLVGVSALVADGSAETWFTLSADGIAGSQLGAGGDPLRGFVPGSGAVTGDPLVGRGQRETWFELSADGLAGSQLGAGGDALAGLDIPDPGADRWGDLVVHVPDPTASAFTLSADGIAGSQLGSAGDALEAYTPALALECEFARLVPPHVRLHWVYAPPAAA